VQRWFVVAACGTEIDSSQNKAEALVVEIVQNDRDFVSRYSILATSTSELSDEDSGRLVVCSYKFSRARDRGSARH
jgi:hypothetical protein